MTLAQTTPRRPILRLPAAKPSSAQSAITTPPFARRVAAALQWLRQTVPSTPDGDPLPLVVGVRDALIDLGVAAGHDAGAVSAAIHKHVSAYPYLNALRTPGAMRHALDGTPVGAVSESHREHAAATLRACLEPAPPARAHGD